VGRSEVPRIEALVEADLVYPLLRGRDVQRWIANPSLSIILPHDQGRPGVGIPENELKRTHHRAYDFFQRLRSQLENRSGYRKYIRPSGGPFYAVYNIGTYTFQPFRVVWREQARTLEACVISVASDGRLINPDHKLTILGFETEGEAHFVCAVLNCTPVQLAVRAYSIEIQISTHVADYIGLPRFDPRQQLHREIAQLGQACHLAAQNSDLTGLARLEAELDEHGSRIWGITASELRRMQLGVQENALAGTDDVQAEPTQAEGPEDRD
jgi:hypothetical protein